MNQPPDPQDVTYEGSNGVYRVLLHGEQIGHAISGYGYWTASPNVDKWAWSAPTRRQAVEQLIAWLKDRP